MKKNVDDVEEDDDADDDNEDDEDFEWVTWPARVEKAFDKNTTDATKIMWKVHCE